MLGIRAPREKAARGAATTSAGPRLTHRAFQKALLAGAVGAGASRLVEPEEAEAAYTAGGSADGGDLVDTNLTVQGNLGVGGPSGGSKLHVVAGGRVAWLETAGGPVELALARAGAQHWALRNLPTDDSFRLTSMAFDATAPFDPTGINGLQVWLRADALREDGSGLVDGAPVASWADWSGNLQAAAQAVGARQPTYRLAGPNGRPYVEFDGVDDYLRTELFPLRQPSTLFVVGRWRATGGHYAVDGAGGANTLVVTDNGGGLVRFYAGAALDAPAVSTNWNVLCCAFVGAASRAAVNGTVTTGDTGSSNASGLTLASSGVTNPTSGAPCDIAEVIAYAGALSDSQRQQVESYLGAKYGISVPGGAGGAGAIVPRDRIAVMPNGRVGVGVVAPGYVLDIAGDVNTAGLIRMNGVVVVDGTGTATQAYYAP